MVAADPGAGPQGPGRLERLCELICEVVLVAMVALIGAEALARSVANVALESADEFGGYLLVAISFLSLSTCQVTGAFHQLELVQARLSPRGRAISRLVFDLLSFAFSAILLWQLTRLTWNAWSHGELAQTEWITPLWMPMLAMPLGMAALCATLVKVLITDVRLISAATKGR